MQVRNRDILALFWRHARRYPWGLTGLVVFIAVESGLNLFVPWLYKRFFDALVSAGQDMNLLVPLLTSIITMFAMVKVGAWVMRRLFDLCNTGTQSRVMMNLENEAFAWTIYHSERFFANTFVGSLVRKVRRLSRAYEVIADGLFMDFWPIAITIIGSLTVVAFRSMLIFWVMVGWIVLFFLGNLWFARRKQPLDVERATLDSEVTGVLADAITNHTTVKVFTGEIFEQAALADVEERARAATLRSWRMHVKGDAVQWGLMAVVEIVMLSVAANLWVAGQVTVGDIALFQGYFVGLMTNMYSIGRAIRRLYEGIADAKEMMEILQAPHEINDAPNAQEHVMEEGSITFDRVGFGYHKGRRILRDLSFTIRSKEKVALVGPSGAGKSTIVKLILRFADISRGKLLLDGQPIRSYTLASLRGQISYVPQESVLFHRTIRENIRYGRPDATDEEVLEAARRARCDVFVERLPQGYDTYVGERGVKLSGGERQRVAIARALLANAPILILDEATSSLDSESERLIQEALEELMKDRTTIVIAHRLSTIMKMDRILVIDGGKLVDQGTHAALSKRAGLYKELWEIQAGGFLP